MEIYPDYSRLLDCCLEMEGQLRILIDRNDADAHRLLLKYYNELTEALVPADTAAVADIPAEVESLAVPEQELPSEPEPDLPDFSEEDLAAEEQEADARSAALAEAQAAAAEEAAEQAAAEEAAETTPAAESDPSLPEAEKDIPQVAEPRPGKLRVDEMLSRREARELRNAFTLNDKFRFRRELFHGDDAAFRHTLDMIQAMSTFEEANVYMLDDLGWDEDDEAVRDFAAIVANHFAGV